jgi:ATP-dependent Clp protease ATP-binding subunit ClpA
MPVIERVVDKFMLELDVQLNEKKVFVHMTSEARRYLAEKGYDPTFGARPMARLIQTEIKRVLADEILFGRLRDGGHVEIDVRDGALTFEYSPPPAGGANVPVAQATADEALSDDAEGDAED